MAQGVAAAVLRDAGRFKSPLHLPLHAVGGGVVAARYARARVYREPGREEDVPPHPPPSSRRVLACERVRQVDLTESFPQVVLVQQPHPFEVLAQRLGEGRGSIVRLSFSPLSSRTSTSI